MDKGGPSGAPAWIETIKWVIIVTIALLISVNQCCLAMLKGLLACHAASPSSTDNKNYTVYCLPGNEQEFFVRRTMNGS